MESVKQCALEETLSGQYVSSALLPLSHTLGCCSYHRQYTAGTAVVSRMDSPAHCLNQCIRTSHHADSSVPSPVSATGWTLRSTAGVFPGHTVTWDCSGYANTIPFTKRCGLMCCLASLLHRYAPHKKVRQPRKPGTCKSKCCKYSGWALSVLLS